MADTQKLLALYTRMRNQGMDAHAALDVLHEAIDALAEDDRLELAKRIRQHERTDLVNQTRPIQAISKQLESSPEKTEAEERIVCPHCGKLNPKGEVLCFSCGGILTGLRPDVQTRILTYVEPASDGDDFFGADSVLVLTARNTQQAYEIRPQTSSRELVVGRRTNSGPMSPDIDLSDSDANRLGVSRLHLSIRYDSQYHTLTAFDLGSANGTYVNGQRLHPHEVRVLRHSDELRLGNMLLTVAFRHNDLAEPK